MISKAEQPSSWKIQPDAEYLLVRDAASACGREGIGVRMDIFNSEAARRSTVMIGMMIAAVALLANLMLIVNPGFYNHDEWQRYDFITTHGVHAYLAKFWVIREGASFATPVRPIGLIQQGLLALWMKSSPWVPHLASAILHCFVAIALFFTAMLAGLSRRTAVLAALLFCTSPLGVLANGWTAASYDQWYVLFTLGSIYMTFLLMRDGLRTQSMLALLCFSSAAILSKETAMVLPVAIAGCGLFTNLIKDEKIQWRRIAAAAWITALPIGVYLLIRLPALQRSMAVGAVTAYRPSPHNLLPNILGYLEFPFIPTLGDMVSIIYVPAWFRHLALLVHLAFIACLAWTGHLKIAVVYLFAYFIFLIPILFIPNTGSHYLYASSIVLSTAHSWLLLTKARVDRARFAVVLFAGECASPPSTRTSCKCRFTNVAFARCISSTAWTQSRPDRNRRKALSRSLTGKQGRPRISAAARFFHERSTKIFALGP
jgi:hypothetical protein